MKVETFIKKYVAKNIEPEQKFCPIVYQYWHGTKNGQNYTKVHNSFTGKIELFNRRIMYGSNYLTPRSYRYEGTYLKEVRNGLLEISRVEIVDTGRGKDGVPKIWKYQTNTWYKIPNRIFLDKETLKAYDVNGNEVMPEEQGKFYNRAIAAHIRQLGNYGRMLPENAQEIWKNFTDVNEVRIRWITGNMNYPYHWHVWYTHTMQRPISNTTIELNRIESKLEPHYHCDLAIEFEIIDGYGGVFRFYNPKERVRIFINSKGKPTMRILQCGKWVTSSNNLSHEFYVYSSQSVSVIGTEDMEKLTCLKYILPIIDMEKRFNIIVDNIITILRHPIIEKLIKAGYSGIAKDLMGRNEVKANIKNYYGMNRVNEKTSIYKCLGLNKAELNMIEKNINTTETNQWGYEIRWRNYSKIIPCMRKILGNDISSLSDDKFQTYWKGCKELNTRNISYSIDPDSPYRWGFERNNSEMTDKQKRILDKLFKYEEKESGIVRAYVDTVSQFRRLRNKPNIDLMDFRNKEDIMQMHDNINALVNAQYEEDRRLNSLRDEERRKEMQKKAERLNEKRVELYECKGNDFSIIIPKDLTELTAEGSTLHHCVGGYLQRYAMGDTNIVFLRKNEDINTPFYTIEVSNSGNIIQIHGKYNCWLGNNPEAISFVNKWIQDRGFKCEKSILLDTASGYSSSGKLVSESYLAA